jgi:hypothetical protein
MFRGLVRGDRDVQRVVICGPGNRVNPATRTGHPRAQAVLTNPRTVLKALELLARLNGELDSAYRMLPCQGARSPEGRHVRSHLIASVS